MNGVRILPPTAMLLSAAIAMPVQAQSQNATQNPTHYQGPGDLRAEAEGERVATLDDLVVTASLEPVARKEVVSSVTVITRADIEARQVKYVGDLLRDVPGFNVSQSGGAGTQTQVRVRGAEANQLLVLIDGVRANDPANSDEFQWQFALTSDIERIEIVRGPQSAIWGSDAVAGVVNIIRRKGAGERRLSGRAELGSFDTVDLAADGAWTSADGDLRVYGGVAYTDTDGINISRTGDEKDGVENTTGNLGVEWTLDDAWTLSALGKIVDATSAFDDTDFLFTGLPVDTDRVTENEQAYLQAEARFAPRDSIWSGNVQVNTSDTDTLNIYDGAFNSSTAADVFELRARGSASWDGARSGSHRVTLAADHRGTDFTQRGIATDFGDPNQDQSLDVTGVAAEYQGQPMDGLTWTCLLYTSPSPRDHG